VTHWHSIQNGLQRDNHLNLHYPTIKAFDSHGFSIWSFDLTADERNEQKRVSKLQPAAIPDPNTRFGGVAALNYRIRLMCAYCNDEVGNDPPDPKLNPHRITAVYRPKCQVCGKPEWSCSVPILGRVSCSLRWGRSGKARQTGNRLPRRKARKGAFSGIGVPYGIRTRVAAVKGTTHRPRSSIGVRANPIISSTHWLLRPVASTIIRTRILDICWTKGRCRRGKNSS
jgi:hypothetical protein